MEGTSEFNIQSEEKEKIKETSTVTGKLLFSSAVAIIGLMEFGWNLGVLNSPQEVIKKFINDTLINRGTNPSEDTVNMVFAVILSIFAAGGMCGGLIAGRVADRFGRRDGMLISSIIMAFAGLFMLVGRYAQSFEMIIVGRLLAGFSSGMDTGIVPLYLNEIAPQQIRGIFGLMFQLGSVFGMFLSQVFGLSSLMGNDMLWNILLGLITATSIIQACLLKLCPRSPKYLLFIKRDEIEAENALRILRPSTYGIQGEMEQMKAELLKNQQVVNVGLKDIIRNATLRKSLIVCIIMHLSQQLSGINNIIYYSAPLFISAGVSKENSEYSILAIGGILITMTLISCPLIERCGRRFLHIGGLCGILVSSVCFTIFYTFQSTVTGFNFLSIISALTLVASFGFGPGSIPWMILPEIFPVSSRSTASCVCIPINWFVNLTTGMIFSPLHAALQNLIMLPFIGCQVLSIGLLCPYMPETKGTNPDGEVGDDRLLVEKINA